MPRAFLVLSSTARQLHSALAARSVASAASRSAASLRAPSGPRLRSIGDRVACHASALPEDAEAGPMATHTPPAWATPAPAGLASHSSTPAPFTPSPSRPSPSRGLDPARFTEVMPKEAIGALRFLGEHPEADGRGVIIAICDSGVDPAAAGLRVTSDGRPKVIDVVDCTGSGDVDTSKIVPLDADGCLMSLTGRKLKINPAWGNPTNVWRVGAKRAYELFPSPLRTRTSKERRQHWDAAHRVAATQALRALAAFDAAHPGPAANLSDPLLTKQKEELEARVKLLKDLADKHEDAGPLLDAVVWHDGAAWRAALDTSDLYVGGPTPEAGKLADFVPLTNFRAERQWAVCSPADACTLVLNIYDEGHVLSIVTDASPHGTHVAGIAAAHHPEEPALNGVAPGAQIVSLKIGDSRLGSMETGVGLTRAGVAILANKCDLINLSYGEPSSTPNSGRFVELARELVHQHGVVFVSSAGNDGPALSTVGAPGGSSSPIIGIGAYVTPALAATAHSVREPLDGDGCQYTWSSRGPTVDGALGVALSAPGGAIAPVPSWTLERRTLMNGTSMSSPCACGGVALVLSALRAAGRWGTDGASRWPHALRRALESSCAPLGDGAADALLTSGQGMLQVDRALALFEASGAGTLHGPPADIYYDVSVERTDGSWKGRGVYLRDPCDTAAPVEVRVTIDPQLRDGAPPDALINLEARLELVPTAAWVRCPAALMLTGGGRAFGVRVDPSELPEGVHTAEVLALDTAAPEAGPLFRVPVTVIQPRRLPKGGDATVRYEIGELAPGRVVRHFVAAPPGATWAELTVRSTAEADAPRSYYLHCVQALHQTRHRDAELKKFVTLGRFGQAAYAMKVVGGSTLEMTTAQFWSSLGPSSLEVEVAFHGLVTDQGGVHLDGAGGPARLDVTAPFGREKLTVAAKISSVCVPLRPTEAKLAPLATPPVGSEGADGAGGGRDTLPRGRTMHGLTLTYKFSLAEAARVTPRLPALNNHMYDALVECLLTMVFDSNKKLLATGDVYPLDVKLKKGDYVIRVLLRHDSPELLEKFKAQPLSLELALENPISLTAYSDMSTALQGGKALGEVTLVPGERRALFVGPPPEDKIPADAKPGTTLRGSVTLSKVGGNGAACPSKLPLTFTVPPAAAKEPAAAAGAGDDETSKPATERLNEQLRDARVKFLKALKVKDGDESAAREYDALRSELLRAFPAHLPLLQEALHRVDGGESATRSARLERIVEAADAVLAAIDGPALAVALMATKAAGAEGGPAAARAKKEADEKKAALADALYRKVLALADLIGYDVAAAPPARLAALEAAFAELRKWAEVSEPARALAVARREAAAVRPGLALKAIQTILNSDDASLATREVYERHIGLLKTLGWEHFAHAEEIALFSRFPSTYPLF